MNIRYVGMTLLAVLFTTSAFASDLAMKLNCQGATDKAVSLSADIASDGSGSLQITSENARASKSLQLISKPGKDSKNYIFSTGDNDANTNYRLQIRASVIENKLQGPTRNIDLVITEALSGADDYYDLNCEVSR